MQHSTSGDRQEAAEAGRRRLLVRSTLAGGPLAAVISVLVVAAIDASQLPWTDLVAVTWPLTRLVQEATQGQSGVDVIGHRDYRGVTVVAAWTWIPEYQLGLAAQIDQQEIRRPFEILRRTAHITLTVLTLSALGLFGLTAVARPHNGHPRKPAIAARKPGHTSWTTRSVRGRMDASSAPITLIFDVPWR